MYVLRLILTVKIALNNIVSITGKIFSRGKHRRQPTSLHNYIVIFKNSSLGIASKFYK